MKMPSSGISPASRRRSRSPSTRTFTIEEPPRALTIADNYWIDAPSVEQWLADNPPPGVDTSKYTIFFINWFDRPDFIHHVYAKTDEPDPDTNHQLRPASFAKDDCVGRNGHGRS